MKRFKNLPALGQKGFMNITMALGIALVVVSFMAPLGLYYVNMFNQNEKARLKNEAQDVAEALGMMIYRAMSAGPATPGGSCLSSSDNPTVPVARRASKPQKMMGEVSGVGFTPGGGPPHQVIFCVPAGEAGTCLEYGGRTYCLNLPNSDLVETASVGPDGIIDIPVQVEVKNPSMWDSIRWRLAPAAEKTAKLLEENFGMGSPYSKAYAVTPPPLGSFSNAQLASKSCKGSGGDPADLINSRNHCISCEANGVMCVRFGMCISPGELTAMPALQPGACGTGKEQNFFQGKVAIFRDRR